MAIEPLYGNQFGNEWRLIVGFDGSAAEVAWQVETLKAEWPREQLLEELAAVDQAEQQPAAWQELTDFSLPAGDVPLVVKFSVRPSQVCALLEKLHSFDEQAAFQAHAGNGIVIAQFRQIPAMGACKFLLQQLQPAAHALGGYAHVWSAATADDFTRPAWWGGVRGEMVYMERVKQQFDPQRLLNPGRFIYEND